MQSKVFVVAAVALVLWAGVALLGGDPAQPMAAVPNNETLAQDAAATEVAPLGAEQSSEGRSASPPVVSEDVLVRNGFTHLLSFSGVLLDQEDQPLKGAILWIAQEGHPWNKAVKTKWNGRFSILLPSNSPSGEILVFVEHDSVNEAGFRSFRITPKENPVRLGVRCVAPIFVQKTVERNGEVREAATLIYFTEGSASPGAKRPFEPRDASLVDTQAGSIFSWGQLAEEHSGENPAWVARILEPPSPVDLPLAQEASIRIGNELFIGRGQWLSQDLQVQLRVDRRAPPLRAAVRPQSRVFWGEDFFLGNTSFGQDNQVQPKTHISGIMRRANGEVAVNAWVRMTQGDRSLTARTDTQGFFEFTFTADLSVDVFLQAGGSPFGRAEKVVSRVNGGLGGEVEWNPILDRGRELTGRLQGPAGAPLVGWCVDFSADGGNWVDSASVDEEGRFALPNLPSIRGRLFLRPDGAGLVSHVVESIGVRETHLEIVLPVDALKTGEISLPRLVRPKGEPLSSAEGRALQEDTGRGAWLQRNDEQALSLSATPGGLRLFFGADSTGYVDLGSLWIKAGSQLEVTPVTPPAMELADLPALDGPVHLVRTDLTFPTSIRSGQAGELRGLLFPAGTYELQPQALESAPVPATGETQDSGQVPTDTSDS